MAHAFVIEWDPSHYNLPIVVDADYRYDPFCGPREKRNECNFILQPHGAKHCCYYPTSSAFEAKVLCRLIKQISNFQIHCQTHDAINKHIANHGYSGLTDMLLDGEKKLKSLGQGEEYCYYDYSNPEHQCCHENIPFHISEIDTKNAPEFKPCFFRQEYKLHDEKAHPLYVFVMLERKNDGTNPEDLFDFNIKFIGSGQPLPKQWQDAVPLCSDEKLYRQKFDEYKCQHAREYEDMVKSVMKELTDPDYKKVFETYSYKKALEWQPSDCEVISSGLSCPNAWHAWGVGKLECWGGRRCQFYKTRYSTIHHDGKAIYDAFLSTFGSEIAQLVKKGAFGKQHQDMMPDFSDPEFIKKFNKYSGRHLHYFGDTVDIEQRKKYLETRIQHLNSWAATPGYDIVRFKTKDGQVHTIQSPVISTKGAPIEEHAEKPDMATHLVELKTQLLANKMARVRYPAIYIKSPGKIKITGSYEAPYMSQISEDEYETFVDVYVNYNKPKLKETQEITYRFTNECLGYDFLDIMRDLHNLQGSDNFKWSPAKLFPKDKGAATTDPYGFEIRREAKKDVIPVVRLNVDYNGVAILDPQKMNPIVCDHYEIHGLDYSQGDTNISRNILLFNAKNEVSGIIHTRFENGIKEIVPNIIAQNIQQRTK